MNIFDCQQGSTEWLQCRLGIPTASCFDRILTPGGKPSASQESYLCELLAEFIMGKPLERPVMPWMEEGTRLEPDARAFYEFQNDVVIRTVGFITNDEGTFGASPDGLVGDTGLVELKCPKPETHVRYLVYNEAPKDYRVQIMGQMLVAKREWVDTCSYHPLMPSAIVRAERDDVYIKLLEDELGRFVDKLQAAKEKLAARGIVQPTAVEPKEWLSDADVEAILASRV
jgi:hypothetical protein